ncbi:hypothetical protein MHI02_05675 [Oceanobacillus sp. FSL K6-0118]|uniref:hypothetical protein n=1 Tax=Oceanobacillus sp. FSL K6-0118 TaxID=2921418 RepID=UPI0030F58279
MQTIQAPQYSVKDGYPGSGAIQLVNQVIKGMSSAEIFEISLNLLDGSYYDSTDKRIKKCDYCGYYWRDDSRNNTKKTCSPECKTAIKSLQKQKQRERKALLEPEQKPKKRHTTRDDYYDFLEYSYWLSEDSMHMYDTNYISDAEEPLELIDYVDAQDQTYGKGNRKVSTYGDEI